MAAAASAATERSALYHAGHRRCATHTPSRSGCRKIATCGLRDSVFSIDDFCRRSTLAIHGLT